MQLSFRSGHSGKFPKQSCHQKQPSGCIFQYRCSALILKFFQRVRFLVNLHVTLCNFEPLLEKFKYFITTLINAKQPLLKITSRNLFCVLKIWGKFSSGRISKPHVGRLQLFWELHWRRCHENFPKRLKLSTAVSLDGFIDQLLLLTAVYNDWSDRLWYR